MRALAFVTVLLVAGSWVTATAILGERRAWVRPLLMATGLALTVLAVLGYVLAQRAAP